MFGNKTIVISVEGMMCEHCAAHVKETLEKIEGVNGVKVDLAGKKVSIKTKVDLADETLEQAITNAGYKYKGKIA